MSKERTPEELAQYLDELYQSSLSPSSEDIDDPMIEVAVKLSNSQPPKLSADARSRMLQNVQQAHSVGLEQNSPQRKPMIRFPLQSALRWVAVFVLIVFMMNNVAIPAMADSLPGDILYPVKLAMESVELSVADSDTDRAEVYLTQAERRLQEANKLDDDNQRSNQLLIATDKIYEAKQLVSSNEIVQSRILVVTHQVEIAIGRVLADDPLSASTLDSALSIILPTPEPTSVAQVDEPQPTLTPSSIPTTVPSATPTLTHTPIPTASDAPTLTPTIVASATRVIELSLLATDEPTSTPAYDSYIGVVSATAYVNVRNQPSTDSEIVQQVAPGTIVTVIGESLDGKWLQIEFEDEQQVWIAASLIVEGTVPLFTLSEEATPVESTSLSQEPIGNQSDTPPESGDSSASNQGNDGINKFGCDGQGNSCNAGNQGNQGNQGNGNGKNK